MFANRNSSWVGIRIMQDPLYFRSNLIQLPLSLFNLWTFALSQSRMNEWQKVSFPGLATLLKRVKNNFFFKLFKKCYFNSFNVINGCEAEISVFICIEY